MGKLVCPWGRDSGTGKLALAHATQRREVKRDDAPAGRCGELTWI